MLDIQVNEKKRAKMTLFVDCTRRLIKEIGYKEVSIRKIADLAGYHNSTIYFYFQDIDLLLALASVRSFEKYSLALRSISSFQNSSSDVFYKVWEEFCRYAFTQPDLYYQFFFGKYCNDITDILNLYYQLFPEEKLEYSAVIEEMYFANNFTSRSHTILCPLIGEENYRVTDENVDLINDVTIAYFKDLLEQKCADPSLDNELLTNQYLRALHLIVDA